MAGTWWVDPTELDSDQQRIISLSLDDDVLVTGPPGSGKTNLLLLRANHLYRTGYHNIVIVTFSRPLCNFITSGAVQYAFPDEKVMTSHYWQLDLLRQYGVSIELSKDFETAREQLADALESVVEANGLKDVYQAILLDEAQDYTPREIRLFRRLGERLFCVADRWQKIYQGEDSISTLKKLLGTPYKLQYHYRNGLKICQVADEIAKAWKDYRPLSPSANYDEKANPSTVDWQRCESVQDQIEMVLARLRTQVDAFPNQYIGILSPTTETMRTIWDAIQASEFSDKAILLHGSGGKLRLDKPVVVSTFHAAKGLEFRALHLVGCDELHTFPNNRRLVYTAVTRAKTALSVYYSGGLHGYIEAALQSLEPAPTKPTLSDLFGGKLK